MDKEKVVEAALKWKGTRWVHGQALCGVGADCVQWILALGREVGWLDPSYKPPVYNRDWALHNNRSMLLEELKKLAYEISEPDVGDVVVFQAGRTESHAGLYIGEGKVLHADIRHGIIESRIDQIRFKNPQTHKYENSVRSYWRPKNV